MEHTTIGGSLEIPCIINGLWQLSGGPPSNDDAVEAMRALFEPLSSLLIPSRRVALVYLHCPEVRLTNIN